MSTKACTLAGEKWFIGGAPRSKNVGQVMMFQQGARHSGYLHLNQAHVLTGRQFGAAFGYDIAVADFNLDRFVRVTDCIVTTRVVSATAVVEYKLSVLVYRCLHNLTL